MNVVTKAILALVLFLSVLSGALWFRLDAAQVKAAQLEQANAALQTAVLDAAKLRASEQVVAQKYAEEVVQLKQQKGVLNAKLREALNQEAAWSDQVVPSGVADALGM